MNLLKNKRFSLSPTLSRNQDLCSCINRWREREIGFDRRIEDYALKNKTDVKVTVLHGNRIELIAL